MGITSQAARFSESVPELEDVISEATRLCGVEVICRKLETSELYRFQAEIAFACYPRERVLLFAYVPGELRASAQQMADLRHMPEVAELAAKDSKVAAVLERWTEAANSSYAPTVHIRGSVGEEGTLPAVLAIALESMGGTLLFPLSETRRAQCSGPLTATEIRARHRQHHRAWMRELAKLPIYIIGATWRRLLRKGA